jgi:hypothetical protein
MSKLLPDFYFVPLQGVAKVKSILKALKAWSDPLRPPCVALIDRDRRRDEEIKALQSEGVFALSVPSLEHIFLQGDVIRAACVQVRVADEEASMFLKAVEQNLADAARKDRETEFARFIWQRFTDMFYAMEMPRFKESVNNCCDSNLFSLICGLCGRNPVLTSNSLSQPLSKPLGALCPAVRV